MMKTNLEIAKDVIAGLWGNGEARKRNLTAEGYDYNAIQSIVNKLISGETVSQEPAISDYEGFLEVEVDLNKVKGIKLIFKE